jgi:TetR/AcrR family transcriptional repressor of nem operon
MTSYQRGCPIGNLALELADSHPAARELLAVNFTGWRKAIEQCLSESAERLPEALDREQLALFVLTTMEGAVMLSRAYQDIQPYDAAVTQLRDYFDRLRRDGTDWSVPRPGEPTQAKPKARAKR